MIIAETRHHPQSLANIGSTLQVISSIPIFRAPLLRSLREATESCGLPMFHSRRRRRRSSGKNPRSDGCGCDGVRRTISGDFRRAPFNGRIRGNLVRHYYINGCNNDLYLISHNPLSPTSSMSFVRIVALAALAASASAFCTSPASCVLSRSSASAMSRPTGISAFRSARTPVNGLKMQTEDDRAKASGIALATVGLVFSKFSLLVAVLAGGAAVYAGECSSESVPSLDNRDGHKFHTYPLNKQHISPALIQYSF